MKRSPKWPRGASASTPSPPSAPTPAPFTAADTMDYLVAHFPAGVAPHPHQPQPPGGPPPQYPPPRLDLRDPEAVHRWQGSLRAALLDLAAAAQEGARRSHKRVLSRGEIRRQAKDALAQANTLLDLAAAGAAALRNE